MSVLEALLTALVPLGAAVFGWALAQRTARTERKAAWDDQLMIRRSQVLADLAILVDAHDLSAGTLRELWERSTSRERRAYLDRWRAQIQSVEREIRALAFLEHNEDARARALKVARSLSTLVLQLDIATDEDEVDWFDLDWVDSEVGRARRGVDALAGFWEKDFSA